MSQSDLRAHFGRGRVIRADTVEIHWPGGLRQEFRNVAADVFYRVVEGSNGLEYEIGGNR